MKIKVKITREENASYFNCNINDVVDVDFQQYVAAVTASEIGNGHIEACKAQAVAARTFAMSRGVLYGKVISDSSSTAQAYRAKRLDTNKYPNALEGARLTVGQVLFYNFKPISAVYGASNGGFTVSSQQRWGSARPYLIAQKDPWDAAAGGVLKGPGVGMSQKGCSYAAKHGVNYKEILKFYYPNTVLGRDFACQDEINKAIKNLQKIKIALRKGNSGQQVVWAQYMLNTIGYSCGTIDGVFGGSTVTAVKNFQSNNGLKVDGILGPKTLLILENNFNSASNKYHKISIDEIKKIKQQVQQIIKKIRGA